MIRYLLLLAVVASAQRVDLEKVEGKTVLLFSPHPDDDMFCCAGTLAVMAKHNNIQIYIYTNGDKGSLDPEMTSERMASIRMKEEIAASKILGIPEQNIHWLEYHDGMLEYADPRDLVEEVTKIIRTVRPDIVMAPDPGHDVVRWHKTDHRMTANNTIDAIRAAEWHLYFPNQRLHEGLMPWKVPLEAYYYTTEKEANAFVNIDSVLELKLSAGAAHVSQWSPSTEKYRPDWDPKDLQKMKDGLKARQLKRDGHTVEAFRITGGFNQQ
jgi:LmbE family N-acetylglucosaminyl deacetylase